MNKTRLGNQRLWIILFTAVTLRIGAALLMGDRVEVLPGIFDQVSYHTLATRLLNGYGFTFSTQWWPITQAGEPTAHWSYLYTFYLTTVYAIFGVHPLAARLIQSLLAGLLMPWLAYRITVHTFQRSSFPTFQPSNVLSLGLIAAAWIALYPYFLYYSAALMTETFYIIGILWTLDCSLRLAEDSQIQELKPQIKNFLELGLAIGLTVLLRQVFLLFVPFLFLWYLWARQRIDRMEKIPFSRTLLNWLIGGVLTALILVAMIAPFTWLNYRHFGSFVLLNTNSGYAFFWANHPIHGYSFVALFTPDMPTYQDLIPQELRNLDEAALNQALMKLGLEFIRQDPWRFIRLSISRIPDHFIFWPLSESSLLSNIARVASFGLALPFMLLGVVIWSKETIAVEGRNLGKLIATPGALLLLFSVVYVGIHLLSWAGIRYRLPTDAVVLVFAARGMAWALSKVVGLRASVMFD